MKAGGFSPFRHLRPEDQKIFDKVIGDIDGVSYTAFAVSAQVVNGTNYHFLCSKETVTADPIETIVIVAAHRSLKGDISRSDDIELEEKK